MKKIGIVAVTYKDNFGSALQTFATQYILEAMDCETEIFNIEGVHRLINARKILFYLRRVFQPEEFKYLMASLNSRSRKKASISSDLYASNMALRHKMYKAFYTKWLKIAPKVSSMKKLGEQAALKDAIVVGSDQLWRPSNIAGRYFTLEFVPDEIKKIALSTSFGVSVIPAYQHNHARKFLNRIEHITVRENTGAKIVKELTGREIGVVCDPTMLLDANEWKCIQNDKPFAEGDYILCYFMGDNPKYRDFVKRLSAKTGYRIIALLHGSTYVAMDEGFADEAPYNVGPGEFVNLIRNARYMCTDSFHGTVFSILNSTKFFTFRKDSDGSENSANDRFHTLLGWTGLSNRMLTGDEDVNQCMKLDVNFEEVQEKVKAKRLECKAYLQNALNL